MEVSFFFGGDISILFVSSLQTKEEEKKKEEKLVIIHFLLVLYFFRLYYYCSIAFGSLPSSRRYIGLVRGARFLPRWFL
jgi:hypothetical protein